MSADRFIKYACPCDRYFPPNDTHKLCVICLGMEHAGLALEGATVALLTVIVNTVKKLHSASLAFLPDLHDEVCSLPEFFHPLSKHQGVGGTGM